MPGPARLSCSSRPELSDGWSDFLPGFDSTHHMVANHAITFLDDTAASAEADFTATHRVDDQLWVLGGRYRYELERSEGRWLVTSMTMTALWGNRRSRAWSRRP